mgnify:CR=1 FL=1
MEWKRIKNYPNYEVSNCGMVMNSRGWILKPGLDRKGYQRIKLCKNGKVKTFKIHRLVADAFIPNPENKSDVDHIDRCKTYNHVSNLRWATRSENLQNTGVSCNNKLGIKNISYDKSQNRYTFKKTIRGQLFRKYFKTLEEAVDFRDQFNCPSKLLAE